MTFIDIDAPVDFRNTRGQRVTSSVRVVLEKNDAKWTAADVRENRRGKWVYNKDDFIPYCSECMMPQDVETPFCASCGADMREEHDD